jgi:hypothetical protein
MNETKELKIFLVGEGRNDLGSRAAEPQYQSDDEPGAIQALLRRARKSGWRVGGARTWKSYRKYKAHGTTAGDKSTVRKIALDTVEHECDVSAFIRDRDKEPNRVDEVNEGIALVEEDRDISVSLIGGVAIPKLEGWILAFLGIRKTEEMSPAKAEHLLSENGIRAKDTAHMVEVINQASDADVADDAGSLKKWLAVATRILQTPD